MQATLVRGPTVEFHRNPTHSAWRSLYTVAAWSTLAVVGSLPIALYAFVAWPPPGSVYDWFTFIQSNRLAAILNLDLVLLIDQILFVPIILAIYVALRRTNEPLVLLGTIGGLMGALLLMVSREATFSLPTLSDQYVAATTDAERTVMLAAGQTLLTAFNGTAFSVGYFLLGISGLLISIVMLRSHVFSKPTAYLGMSMYALAIVPPTVGTVGVVLSLASLVPLVPFQILLARRFFQMTTQPPC